MNIKIKQLLKQAEQQRRQTATGESSVAFANRVCSDADVAETLFERLKLKLFHIEKWNAESFLTGFKLFDANGNVCAEKSAAVGDFIRLSLAASGKDDWVKIIRIADEADGAVIGVQPSYNPTADQPDKSTTSHFFVGESINNFCLGKNGETVSFYVIGLNEKTNTGETETLMETVRNVAVSNIGSYLGIQTGEWKTFCENFLNSAEC